MAKKDGFGPTKSMQPLLKSKSEGRTDYSENYKPRTDIRWSVNSENTPADEDPIHGKFPKESGVGVPRGLK